MDETLKQACIIDAKKQEVITDAVTKSSTLDKHDEDTGKWALRVEAIIRSSKSC